MASVNKVILVGRLGKDPTTDHLANGTAVCKFSLATSRSYKDRNGQRQEETDWHNIVMFGKVAEVADKYLYKGSLVYVEGSLHTRKYEDKSGGTRYFTEVSCPTMQMLGDAGSGKRATTSPPATSPPSTSPRSRRRNVEEDHVPPIEDETDLPF